MIPFFFYGTLNDPAIFRRVTGQDAERKEPATLPGFRRVRVAGRDYPMLVRRNLARVEGWAVFGLGKTAARRLDAYEGYEYRRVRLKVRTATGLIPAFVYMTKPGVKMGRRTYP